jgi:hypothetical protein
MTMKPDEQKVSPDLSPARAKGLERAPQIGETVLFKIHDNPEVLRPFLVCAVHQGGQVVQGMVWFCPGDELYDWPTTHFRTKLGSADLGKHLTAPAGDGDRRIGTWRFR